MTPRHGRPRCAGPQYAEDAVQHVAWNTPKPSTFGTGTHLLWVGDERANELPLLFAGVHLNGRSHQRSRVDPLDPVMKCALAARLRADRRGAAGQPARPRAGLVPEAARGLPRR